MNFCNWRHRAAAGSQITLPALLSGAFQTGLLTNSPLALSYDNSVLGVYFLLSNIIQRYWIPRQNKTTVLVMSIIYFIIFILRQLTG